MLINSCQCLKLNYNKFIIRSHKLMPELPEVETIRRGLKRRVVGKRIKKIIIKKPKLIKNSGQLFKKTLIDNSFADIQRIGKLLIFSIKFKSKKAEPKFLLIHLKMTGQLVYCDKNNFVAGGHANSREEERRFFDGQQEDFCREGEHTHIIFELNSQHRGKTSMLFFNDLRQFGYLKIVNEKELKEIKSKFGVEPGQRNFTWQNFRKIFFERRGNIKALLLNQKIISGLGNIYVDEILFASRVKPTRLANSLSESEIKKIFSSTKNIIKRAIKFRGTTFSDFVDSRGRKGNFKQKLKVYGRQGKKCQRCKKSKIEKKKIAGRGTHFCSKCQK